MRLWTVGDGIRLAKLFNSETPRHWIYWLLWWPGDGYNSGLGEDPFLCSAQASLWKDPEFDTLGTSVVDSGPSGVPLNSFASSA